MTAPQRAPAPCRVAVAGATPPQLDYTKVRAYWKSARPSLLGPYMMDGFGFPVGAGRFRFRGEIGAVAAAIKDLEPDTSVLDLGSGVGVWAEYFAQRFSKVVAVEASSNLYEVLASCSSRYPNLATHNRDVLSFELKDEFGPSDKIGLVFLGGLLMYLNDHDIAMLLRKLIPYLKPETIVLCRESTIRRGVNTLPGDYQVTYRSVETYRDMLAEAGYDVLTVQANTAYINAQMGCELIKKWKTLVPNRFRCLPIVGHLVYWGLRVSYPWSTKLVPWLFDKMGREFPLLTNHFFVLRPSLHAAANRQDASSCSLQAGEERFENVH